MRGVITEIVHRVKAGMSLSGLLGRHRANRLKVGEVILVPLADTHVKKHQRDE